ncbi:phage tail protein [Mucilaginibacter celer]|nr:tail fiber protein [Mucilaginibacter celer]
MEPYIGEVRMFAGTYAPQGWATCDGQTMSIAQNQALFALIGTTYGGDGIQTFQLPDLRGRAPVHAGQGRNLSPYTQGQTAGAQVNSLTVAQMPQHSHLLGANSAGGNQIIPTNFYPSDILDPVTGSGTPFYSDVAPDVTLNPATIQSTGGGQPFSIQSPVLAVTFIIALTGIWPPRP